MVNRQRTGFDEVCAGVGEGGEVLGVRVFGDCDHVMKELMKLLLSDVEREKWEKERGKRMLIGIGRGAAGAAMATPLSPPKN